MSPLPSFKTHPDPISTEMIVASQIERLCCREGRGFIYVGPASAVEAY
ncbi:hypothetical protein [Aureimonas sp. ME7]|nr:hypothetical protein [Aureimonas sp. ME7]